MISFVRVRTVTRDVTFFNPTHILCNGNMLMVIGKSSDLDPRAPDGDVIAWFYYPFTLEYESFGDDILAAIRRLT